MGRRQRVAHHPWLRCRLAEINTFARRHITVWTARAIADRPVTRQRPTAPQDRLFAGAHSSATARQLSLVRMAVAPMDDPVGVEERPVPVTRFTAGSFCRPGGIAACAARGGGAMAVWTALFLRDATDSGAGVAALAFAAFSITMTAGRLGGEAAIRRLGAMRVLQTGGTAATAGILVAVTTGSTIAGLVGFGLVGVGFSCALPLALTTAGQSSDTSGGGGSRRCRCSATWRPSSVPAHRSAGRSRGTAGGDAGDRRAHARPGRPSRCGGPAAGGRWRASQSEAPSTAASLKHQQSGDVERTVGRRRTAVEAKVTAVAWGRQVPGLTPPCAVR